MPVRAHIFAFVMLLHVAYMTIAPIPTQPPSGLGPAMNAGRDIVRDIGWQYREHTGFKQSWAMFSSVAHVNAQLQIAMQFEGGWTTLYAARDHEATWNRRTFDHYRWREMSVHWGQGREERRFRSFVAWVSERIFEEFPEAEAVRVRTMRGAVPPPEVLRRDRGWTFDDVALSRTVRRSR